MDQTYLEVLVARKRNMAAAAGKVIGGILAVFSLLLLPGSIFFAGTALLSGAAAYFCYLQEWVEFEYSYVCRELTVDKIMARSRRKKLADYQIDKVEIGAPDGSYRLDAYRNKSYAVKDYSSKTGKNTFVLYYEGQQKIILDGDEGLLQALHAASPGRIFLK